MDRTFLSRRLAAAILIPIGLLVALGLVLGRQLLSMSDDTRWVVHSDQVLRTAGDTLLQVVDQETGVRGYLITGDRGFLEPFEESRPLDGFAAIHALVADNPPQQARFAEARARYESWLDDMAPIVQQSEVRATRTAAEMRRDKTAMDRVRDAMNAAIDVEHELRHQRLEASQESVTTTKIVFVVLLAVVAILLGFLSRRQLGAIAERFGSALDAEKAARQAVEGEAWIREGHARLSEALQGEKPTDVLAADCLKTLATYAQADVGAFFSRQARSWQRRASLALDSRAAGEASFADGEGLVGRAAAGGSLVDLRDVPRDYLSLRSGTGETSPAQIVLVPARLDQNTFAVLELGFLHPAGPRTLALLERVGEPIAHAVRSSEYKEALQQLLEETQRQAEELRVQQEELQVQNEELDRQRRALQESQAHLEHQQTELEETNSHLADRTRALEDQRDHLTRAQADLQRADQYKSEFLANMSHELRTPLNSSLILAKLLLENREGNLNPEQLKFARTIYSAGNDLLTLINDILDLSKIEAGKLDVRPEDISLARLVDELRATFGPVAQDKGLELSLELGADAPAVIRTDPTRVQQILRNLLSNALKFTDQGGVSLSLHPAGRGTLAFEVKDTGIGIPAEHQQVIFDAFRQADGTSNRKFGGTGLGLSISRDLARLLGGELTVASAPGRGSTFTLILPERYAGPDTSAAPQPTSLPMVRRPAPAAAIRAETAPAATDPLVDDDRDRLADGSRALLIIEDDAHFAGILHDLAHELDFRALIARTAEEGLAMVRRYHPSAIVLDVGLPDRSGLSVLDALKHDSSTRHIPVHMISVSDYTQSALEMGAAGYAIKPVEREQLVAAIKRLETRFTRRLRRVLIVEDDDTLRESTSKLLAGDDVEIVAVGTAADALAQLGGSTFDCMVLDLSLPDRSGFELLEEMAGKEQYGFPPVIVYTGRALSRDEEQQLRRFSHSIIVKGARSPERLLDEVTLFLHQVESELPPDRQRMLRDLRHRDAVFEDRRILVVEDDIRNIFALSSLLEPRGARVEIARNGREAVARLDKGPTVDLVLMDIMMPEMDGLQAMREIRRNPAHASLPIIALTAKAMADDREGCLAAGANDYIAKPLDVDKLLSLARVWMRK